MASLARLVKLGEIDNLLQTVMFTLYGNQYDEGEEHLLLSMFEQVLRAEFTSAKSTSNLLRSNTALTRMMTTYTRFFFFFLNLIFFFLKRNLFRHVK